MLSILCLLSSCVERFYPEVDKYDGLLVVEGKITNEPGPYTIRLNRSIGVYDFQKDYLPEINASVHILDDLGNSFQLSEIEAGVYQNLASGLQGIPGRSYKLIIDLENGETYETPFEKMKEPTSIESVDARIEYKYFLDEDAEIPGYQFYISGGPAPNEKNYYLWQCEATYQYRSDFSIFYIFEGFIDEFPNPDSLATCWRTFPVKEIFTLSTANFADPKFNQVPFLFQRVDDKVVSIRYSLLTKQYSINETAYTFWNSIKNQIANTSSLYNTQPYQIRGNIFNIADEEEPVLGYFLVASVAENRTFVDKPTDPDIELSKCVIDPMALPYALMLPPSEWPIYITEVNGFLGVTGVSPNDGCLDCREIGGTIVKPGFWVD
ncbi:MAG: hypothetical protein DHS20C18_17920 [Saprospiraceae bacterium]|nr:MAG: hypothetical protein DHS20C18_17920 [Saprospiraceae bacterium]